MKNKPTVSELLASVVVFLVALPLCMGIAVASGVPPVMGIVSGIIGGIVVGSLAGSPLQVSGPAAGLAVIVYEIVGTPQPGQEYGEFLYRLGPIVVIAGVIQMVAGKLKLGQWFRAVTPAVIYAMLAGIGVLIFSSQFHMLFDLTPPKGLEALITIPSAIQKGLSPADGTSHQLAAGVGILTLLVLVGWNAIRTKLPGLIGAIPAPLLAIIAGTAAAAIGKLGITYVEVPNNPQDLIHFPTTKGWTDLLTPSVFGSAIAVALVASAESLLCASAVDRLHSGERSDLDQELFAQGVGNTVAGFLGGLPITGVIVRSTANIDSGAKTRWSAIIHGVWLLAAVALFPELLSMVPRSALAAILVYIGYRLVNVNVPKTLWARDKGDFVVYMVTVCSIVATSLLTGLLIGIALSVLKLIAGLSKSADGLGVPRISTNVEINEGPEGRVDIALKGSGAFTNLPILSKALDTVPAGKQIHFNLDGMNFVDHAIFEALNDWKTQYVNQGGEVELTWSELQKRGVMTESETKYALGAH